MLTYSEVRREDSELLFELFASTRADEFSLLGWNAQQLETFLRLQYAMQSRSYETQYPHAEHLLIKQDDVPVGAIRTAKLQEAWVLVHVALFPAYRNRGMGSAVMRELQRAAEQADKPIQLHVMQQSPAVRFYERHGFRKTAESMPYAAMEWRPGCQ